MKQTNRAFTRVVSLMAVLLLLIAATVIPASATESNKVNDVTKGVFLIVYTHTPSTDQPDAPDRISPIYSIGTGFLINENTIITAYHVLHDDAVHAALQARYGDGYRADMQIRVYYKAGAFLKAKELQEVSNSSYDFTALQFVDGKTVNGAQQLTLAGDVNENTLISPTPVYSLGYPYTTIWSEDFSEATFTPMDVDTKNGIVNKFEIYQGFRHIKHTAVTLGGMSGGPLVTEDGRVVGVNRLNTDVTESENWAVPISQVIDSLNQMNIDYVAVPSPGPGPGPEPASGPEPSTNEIITGEEPTSYNDVYKKALNDKIADAEKLNEKDYKKGFEAVKGALSAAKMVADRDNATQEEVDAALSDLDKAIRDLPEPSRIDLKMIIIIAVAAIVLIALVVILLVVFKKKKNDTEFDAPGGFAPPPQNGGFNPPPQNGGFAPPPQNGGFAPANPSAAPRFTPAPPPTAPGGAETSVLNKGGNETTVLNSGSSETTVLSGKPYAKLTRKSNNEIIQVNTATFVIGKERRKVNYCIEDNPTISRSHAQITNSGSRVSVTDLGSKNGTFVNSVKCNPNEAIAVKDGDKITLSDEEFIINII